MSETKFPGGVRRVEDVAQALAWESYTCRCGEPMQHYLSTKYCPGSDAEGPLWADYLVVPHDHVHWA